MKKCVTVSDFYLQDVPESTFYMPNRVTSLPEKPDLKGQIINRTKWHAHLKPVDWNNALVSSHHNYASFVGKGLKVIAFEKPNQTILNHWSHCYGEEYVPEFVRWDTAGYRIVSYPMESLPTEHHAVDPDVHYKVHSKKFLGEIDVSQAAILKDFKSPCMVKVTNGSDSSGVQFVQTIDEFNMVMDKLNRELPGCETVITMFITDVTMTYNCHFYVTKKGAVQWVGASEQYLEGTKSPAKLQNIIRITEQASLKELLYPPCKIVGEALHKEGYFGYCGNDIVVTKTGNPFVVDINPRVNGCTSLNLSSLLMNDRKAYSVSSYRRHIVVSGIALGDLVEKIEKVDRSKAMVVLVYVLPCENGLKCGIRVHANSQEMCENITSQIEKIGQEEITL